MKIVIDTNILFSFVLNRESIIRKIIISNKLEIIASWYLMDEIFKYKSYLISKAKMQESEFFEILKEILMCIQFKDNNSVVDFLEEAKKIMQNIDLNDSHIIATALSINPDYIWSNDKHLKQQNQFKVLNTEELVQLLEKQKFDK